MDMMIKNSVEQSSSEQSVKPVEKASSTVKTQKTAENMTIDSLPVSDKEKADGQERVVQQGKEPAKSTIDDAITQLNNQIKKTHCAYAYDEDTKRITIKVYDDETDELIREVPPEKTLEAIKKIWEIAGIIVDEKR